MLSKHFKEIKNQIMKSINQKSYSVFIPFLIGYYRTHDFESDISGLCQGANF